MWRETVEPSTGRERRESDEEERKAKKNWREALMEKYNSDASMKDVGLWELSVYCVYYTVSREDIKPCGLCPVKMMSYAF